MVIWTKKEIFFKQWHRNESEDIMSSLDESSSHYLVLDLCKTFVQKLNVNLAFYNVLKIVILTMCIGTADFGREEKLGKSRCWSEPEVHSNEVLDLEPPDYEHMVIYVEESLLPVDEFFASFKPALEKNTRLLALAK